MNFIIIISMISEMFPVIIETKKNMLDPNANPKDDITTTALSFCLNNESRSHQNFFSVFVI